MGQHLRQPSQQQLRIPSPVGGLNFSSSTIDMPVTDAYLLDNFIGGTSGIEVRKGWKYWVPQTYSFAYEVRTIIPHNPSDPTKVKLFVTPADPTGPIYDITNANVNPPKVYTPSTAPDVPGEWYYADFITAGNSFLCIVAAGAGYHLYDTTNGWRKVTTYTGGGSPAANQIKFPDSTVVEDLAYVIAYKSRLWFIKKNSALAYYLPIGSITGVAQLYDFGPVLRRGGPLAFLMSWTYDSGDGMDDAFIVASYAGDVLIFEGQDPSDVSQWSMKGLWYAGRMVYGRRNFTRHGGDVVMLTEYGIIKISELVAGKLHTADMATSFGVKINNRLSELVSSLINVPYWFLLTYPTETLLILGSPYVNENIGVPQSFMMSSMGNSWSTMTNMEPYCAAVFQGQFIYGMRNGSVCQGFYGHSDGTSADESVMGQEVTGRFQGSFLDFRDGTKNKRLLRCKVYGLTDSDPLFFVTFKPEYELTQVINVGSPPTTNVAIWDQSLWDNYVWSQNLKSLHKWFGVAAFGKKLSMQMAIRGSGRVLLTDFEVLFEQGLGL